MGAQFNRKMTPEQKQRVCKLFADGVPLKTIQTRTGYGYASIKRVLDANLPDREPTRKVQTEEN